jgi:8-oxo-dGTP pyrophosphatase MutT (NUDIX family)
MKLPTMPGARLRTVTQVSAGGVVYRRAASAPELDVVLIRVGPKNRWQLPKGLVEHGESPGATAVREVREEAGVDGVLVAPLEEIQYWYVGAETGGERVRFHKRVHFFLLEYQSGDVREHDDEVAEARWVPLAEAERMLSFASEQKVAARARTLLQP